EPQQQPQGGGLAGAVRAEQAEHLPGADIEVKVVQGAEAAVMLRQPLGVQEHGGHSFGGDAPFYSLPPGGREPKRQIRLMRSRRACSRISCNSFCSSS